MSKPLLLALILLLRGWSEISAQTFPCAAGLEVSLTTQSPAQGRLMLVTLTSPVPLEEVRGGWAGQTLYFWHEGDDGNTYRAFLGVDLQKEPSAYPLALSATFQNGQRVGCSVFVSVRDGGFVVERLEVENRFVELSQEDLERSRRESERLRQIFSSVTPERLWRGPFRLPLEGFQGSGNFGKRRVFNDQPRSPHGGEDFPAPTGTPIRAPQVGRVVLAANHFFSGNTVVLDHGLGLYTYHCHMSSMAVEEGQMVEAGDLLGRVGATGRVTGPHLHWTVRLNNARVNPQDLVEIFSDTQPP